MIELLITFGFILITPIIAIFSEKLVIPREKREEKKRIKYLLVIFLLVITLYSYIYIHTRLDLWIAVMLTGILIYNLAEYNELLIIIFLLIAVLHVFSLKNIDYVLLLLSALYIYFFSMAIENKLRIKRIIPKNI